MEDRSILGRLTFCIVLLWALSAFSAVAQNSTSEPKKSEVPADGQDSTSSNLPQTSPNDCSPVINLECIGRSKVRPGSKPMNDDRNSPI